jgi:hypothetical protein
LLQRQGQLIAQVGPAEYRRAAATAKARLAAWQDPAVGDGPTDLEVLRLMAQLRAASVSARINMYSQLAWYGERAVPLLVEAVRTESDYTFVSDCSSVLLMIGGPRNILWDAKPPKETKEAREAKAGRGKIPDAERLLGDLGGAVEASLRRDSVRGAAVFPDYADFHEDAARDAVCLRLRADLNALLPVLRERLSALP